MRIKNVKKTLATLLLGIGVGFCNSSHEIYAGDNQSPSRLEKHLFGGGLTHSLIEWRELRKGLYFTQVDLLRGTNIEDIVGVLKIDPENYSFRVFFDPTGKNIDDWQDETKAPIIFNSSYFEPDYSPTGLIIAKDKKIGPSSKKKMAGMFLANSKNPYIPNADVIDLEETDVNLQRLEYSDGVQSFPLLVDFNGKIKVNPSEYRADRTVIANDKNGDILLFSTEGRGVTLYDMALFLRDSSFSIKRALNLDGGLATALKINIGGVSYSNYGGDEIHPKYGDISRPGLKLKLPAVIGVFQRE